MKRARRWSVGVVSVGVYLAAVGPAPAASFTLTPPEREAAVRAGKRSIVSEEFGGEWKVAGDRPGLSVTVMTPFHRLALAARNSAFKSQELPPKDIDALLKAHEGTLVVWAALEGGKPDFAQFYVPVLVSGQQEIKASFRQNERTARREENGRYSARCLYVFPVDRLKPSDTLTLIVRDSNDEPVAKFTVNLSAMR